MRLCDGRGKGERGVTTIENILLLFVCFVLLLGLFAAFSGGLWVRIRSSLTGPAPAPSTATLPSGQSPASSKPLPTTTPDPAPSALVIALFASLLTSMAWNVKQLITSLTNRAQLRILETLSSGRRFSRKELKDTMKSETLWLTIFPELVNQALLVLVMAGKVKVDNGSYWLPMEYHAIISKVGNIE